MPHQRASRRVLGVALGLALVVATVLSPGSASAASAGAAAQPQAAGLRISVMSLNIFYGGDDLDLASGDWCPVADDCPATLHKIVRLIRASGADVVGVQEAERNTARLARLLGWHADPRAHVVSRFPILRPVGGQGLYTFVEPVPGRIVAVANTHLPSTPYGPYKVQRGASRAKVLALEERLRVAALTQVLRVLPKLAARGIPVFLTGDFNSPSHLDWTPAVAAARPDVPYAVRWPASAALAAAGFADSYRVVHPDPLADPGFTWTPGSPEGRSHDVFDRIDWVLAAGPATAVSSLLVGEKGNPQVDVALPGRYPSDHRGVVSTFEITPAEAPPAVSPAGRRVVTGDGSRLRVRFHGTGAAGEVVGVVARSRGDQLLVARSTGGRRSGGVSLSTSRLAAGRYDVVLRDTLTGQTFATSPIWVYGSDSRSRMKTDARSYRAGQPIRVSWDRAPGEHLDWIGLYRCRRTCDDPGGYLAYRYTHTRVEGALTLSETADPGEQAPEWPLPPGQYVARLLVDDSYRVVGETPRFRVLPAG
ncbi:MAG TPA: endonuclease/exonuclease/phosphatase family protein [Nocardioides sp.]|uniref:endonuclease/exonuclease/phosphatase family protein n=1 Tax=Nocardioides sp. TaxID=35761 RepID=UPI002E3161D5|nr:endonuclease/exonuclease/phosphatase family protein [Nocardioides sp.]HEX5088679.1 endonuclease/exonuclease/phosphatase family protein [Nocardioides sp.]